MTTPLEARERAAILAVLRAYHEAMVGARTDLLDQLVAADFFLVHITGYRQPRHEWYEVIRRGDFDYHAIDVDQSSLSLQLRGEAAVLTGRGIFNATINGMKNPWRLQFTMRFGRRGGSWIVLDARYSSF